MRIPVPSLLSYIKELQQSHDNSVGKESACNEGVLGLIPGLGRFPGKGKGYPLQYSSLENSMVCIIHGVAKSWKELTFTSTFIAVTEGFLGGSAVKNPP